MLLLSYIIWQLGSKVNNTDEQPETEDIPTVETEDWDEEAEYQSRIWHQFLRENKEIESMQVSDSLLEGPSAST